MLSSKTNYDRLTRLLHMAFICSIRRQIEKFFAGISCCFFLILLFPWFALIVAEICFVLELVCLFFRPLRFYYIFSSAVLFFWLSWSNWATADDKMRWSLIIFILFILALEVIVNALMISLEALWVGFWWICALSFGSWEDVYLIWYWLLIQQLDLLLFFHDWLSILTNCLNFFHSIQLSLLECLLSFIALALTKHAKFWILL